ncbi:MAG: TetR/AcrR family transcriptional regulator [Thermoguttaceae bacterium]
MPKLTAIRKQALNEMMKEAIYDATIAVMTEFGVDGLTMDRVAAEAGVAKGSLYHYFESKRYLIEFVFTKTIAPIEQDLEEIATKEQPAVEKLAAHFRNLLEHIAERAQVHKLLFEDETAHGLLHPLERRLMDVACRRMAAVFRQGMDEGAFRPGDPLMLANMYFGLCKAVLQTEPELAEPDQREKIHHLLIDTFLNGIATQNGRV